jgi:hypothetical protein
MFFTKRPKNILKNSRGAHRMSSNFTMAEESDPMSVGIIARDSGVNFLGARSLTKKVWANPKAAEVMTALFTVTLKKEVGFFDVILERDALHIVKEANSDPPHHPRIGHFIESIQ